jgi:MFS family permease
VRAILAPYRGLDRRVVLLAVARAINTMGFSIVMPFLAMYLVEARGVSGATYGTVYLVSGLLAALGNAVAGEAADRFGRRTMMLAALLLRAVNMGLLGLAVLRSASIWTLGLLVVVNGTLRAFFDPAASAAVTELVPAARRTAAFGLQRIGVNLGWALGPALGGALAAAHSYGMLFFVAAAIMLVAAGAVARVGETKQPETGDRKPETGDRGGSEGRLSRAFVVYLGLVLLGAAMTVQIFATLSVYARTELHLSQADIGLLYTVNGVLVVLLQVPAVAFIERGGPQRALILGPLVYCIAFATVGLANDFPQLAGAMAVLTAGEVIFAPALSDMAAHLGDPAHIGRAFGLFGLMQQLGISVGPLLGGVIYDQLRHRHLAMWGTVSAGMAVIGCGYALFARYIARR